MDEILKDDRFSHIATDPRFKKVPKNQRKVKIDKRFQSIFSDKRFQVKYTVDKRGRPVNQSSSDNFKKYYKLSSDDDSEGDDAVESDEEPDSSKLKSKDTDKKRKSKIKDDNNDDSVESEISDDNETSQFLDRKNLIKIKKSTEELDQSDSSEEDEEDKKVVVEQEQLSSSSQLDSTKKRSKLPEQIREKLHNLNIDYARGMGTLMSDSSSDEATDDDLEGENEDEVEHNWGELDKDADTTDSATHRLAICNMDWDRIRAVDLMVLCSSFVPSGGHIKSITIYPSEFGLKRMKEEELKGPIELAREKVEMRADEPDENSDEEEGSKYHMERLRQYQLNRLKYYYAVVECDSVETASKLYSECDGMEYESSSTRLDLRFIPNDVMFDEEPKEVCKEIHDMNKYEPRFFVNTALQQGKVACTWDETDPERTQLAQKLHQKKDGADNLNDEDLQMFLASSSGEDDDDDTNLNKEESNINKANSEDSEGNSSEESDGDDNDSLSNKKSNTSKSIEKYRNLLNKIQEDEEKKKNRDVEMEITWGVGLKEKAQMLVDKKLKEKAELTPFEQMIEKKKERRKQKKEEKSKKKEDKIDDDSSNEGDDNALFSDDDVPDDVDLNDDYFKEELGNKVANKSKKNKSKKKHDELDEEAKRKRDELELLLIDDEDKVGNVRKSHFNLKHIQQSEENQSKKKRKGRKQIIKNKKHEKDNSTLDEDDFQVNLNDDRFNAVFTSHHYNIDPADPHFRKTKGMDAFINEKISRKYKESVNQKNGIEDPVPTKKTKLDAELSNVVSSIKKKTKGLK